VKKIILIVILVFIFGCTQTQTTGDTLDTAPGIALRDEGNSNTINSENNVDVNWRTAVLEDVNTGEFFSVNDFLGKTVLLESFAVWCPTCTVQQIHIQTLHDEMPEIITISIDTDTNEDEEIVRSHVNANSFTGRYVVATKAVAQSLVDEFGFGVVNAPSAPVVLVCEDGTSRLMARGLKPLDELKEEIEKGC
jgi:thiol-disulfide isomerase/thioredoxin